MVSLTAKMNSITWTGIEEDSEGERDGKGVKEYVGSPEAREAALHMEGQLILSPDLLEKKKKFKFCEESV